ncbi:DEAD/DEAH box helicase [Anaerosporobacter faecicola]|uniref:DEAD/DEAH box helicase n=1 Tax=Anaerosporobacter faecicola TaxID=2718714 RepID=UPI00143955A7|nr:DEAD/DEAH box helicase family protein [Anaerosporobacter faecicola]
MQELDLWKHQREAVELSRKYINNYRFEHNKSALIQMPTGTGKSGVIAVLSRLYEYNGVILVFTPRKYLRSQLVNDIKSRFFNKINYNDSLFNNVIEISCAKELKRSMLVKGNVLVMTLQMLSYITNLPIFEELSKVTELTMIDEGHYEPAKEWNINLNKLNGPKILFTATPYRNDLKLFNIDVKYSFCLSLQECQELNILRHVNFIVGDNSLVPDYNRFVANVIEIYNNNKNDNKTRAIIQCNNCNDIRRIAKIISKNGYSVIGIHDQFEETDGWERKNVPDPNAEEAIFWVHQYKLVEGIDDSNFRMLFLYSRINNARSLVQEIGRIIRNPNIDKNLNGIIVDYYNGYHKDLWNNYLLFDKAIRDNKNIDKLVNINSDTFIKKDMDIKYFDGKFRKSFEFDSIDPLKDIQIPFKANIIEKSDNFDMSSYLEALNDFYEEEELDFTIKQIETDLVIVLSLGIQNSKFLINHVLLEPKLNIMLIKESNNHIFIYNSRKKLFTGDSNVSLGNNISTKKLSKMFRENKETNITEVSLSNTNIGLNTIRSKSISADSIQESIPAIDDYAHVCTRVTGYIKDKASEFITKRRTRRYIGFSHSTIIQNTTKYQTIEKYLEWIHNIETIIESNIKSNTVFNRYALEIKVPKNPQPKSILFDINEVNELFININNKHCALDFIDSYSNITNGMFTLEAANVVYTITIKYDNGKYILSCKELERDYININDENYNNIITYLNKTQSFSVVPESVGCIYISGNFYSPKFKMGSTFDKTNYEIKNCFITDEVIGNCNSEKGFDSYYTGVMDTWDPKSLFGYISSLGKETSIKDYFGDPDIIVCDDGGTEIADFILCDTVKQRVIFIHAKAKTSKSKDSAYCSASGLHEVCSQATKNLGYLAMFNDLKPSKLNSWDNEWSGKISSNSKEDKSSIGKVKKRVKTSKILTKNEVWNEIKSCINNPLSEKEVWIMLGNILSKSDFENRLEKKKPAAFAIHAAYLLNATAADVSTVGAKFRIVCAP